MVVQGPSSVIIGLWVPVFFLAHIFSGYWLFKATLLANPGAGGPFRRLFRRGKKEEDELPQSKEESATTRAQSLDTRVLAEAADAPSPRAGARGEAGQIPGDVGTRRG